jgi:hypothetical protein
MYNYKADKMTRKESNFNETIEYQERDILLKPNRI